MNMILLFPGDFTGPDTVLLTGRRRDHLLEVHRAVEGDVLLAGVAGGKVGRGTVVRAGADAIEMRLELDSDPPSPPPITLVLALPRPKALSRIVASVTSIGVKRLFLIDSWRVEKSFWESPRLAEASLFEQIVLGLEQAKDTVLPVIEMRKHFRPFAEDELPSIARGTRALIAHPYATENAPHAVEGPVTLAIGPDGGFIENEIRLFEAAGFTPVTLGPRVLRVETAVALVLGRILR
ncbi:MAG: 16S rRNA (uracil(1498)-N(3))-methyltransferase [Thermoanaerobaculia bacterium]